jgi:hypothetical protein
LSELKPARSTALMCTNTSLPPSSGAMKPKPLVALNHLTVPVVIFLLQDAQKRDVPARPSRGLDPISAMSWGMEPVRRGQQGRSSIRMGGVYAIAPDKASGKQAKAAAQSGGSSKRGTDGIIPAG